MVAVVTGFHTRPYRTVAAASQGAGIQARIGVHTVTVIAGFKALLSCLEVLPARAVTASGSLTDVGACIAVVAVAIIARFAVIHATVAATL